MTARRWCFTLNNYQDGDIERLGDHELLRECHVRYLIVGRETAGTGTPHLQGYVEFAKCVRGTHLKKLVVTGGIHYERAQGNPQQNIQYCSKEDRSPITYGTQPGGNQGKRSDLDQAADLVKAGASIRDLCQDRGGLYVKYSRGFERLHSLFQVPRNFPTNIVWRFGRTGTGKSRDTHLESQAVCGERVCWLPDKTLKWFDGLSSDCTGAVIDEFDGTCSLPFLLSVLDRYPLKVPVKGGFVEFRCRWVWITSQADPVSYYSGDLQFTAFARRLRDYGVVFEYKQDGSVEEYPPEHWNNMVE